MAKSPLELQRSPYLRYKFRNITLLYEALTHSFDDPIRVLGEGNVRYKKKSFYRLKTLGISVFKLMCSEQAFRENSVTAGPGVLTEYVKTLSSRDNLIKIGRNLELHKFIEVTAGYPVKQIEDLYPDVIKAIFGAVFVDASSYGLMNNTAISQCNDLLHAMFAGTIEFNKTWKTEPLDVYFPSPGVDVFQFLVSRGHMDVDDMEQSNVMCAVLGYEFENRMLLREALTHGSVKQYDIIKNVPDYQRLELLGDAVYELVICEYLYWYYVKDDNGDKFNKKEMEKYTSEPFQHVLAEYVHMGSTILKPGHVEVKSLHVFLESVLGAIYVDSWFPMQTVRKVIINLTKECTLEALNAGCSKLPYSIRTHYTTRYHLTNELPGIHDDLGELPLHTPLLSILEIADVKQFATEWQYYAASSEIHKILLSVALAEAEDKMEKSYLTLDSCHRAEFKRRNLYGIAAEMMLAKTLPCELLVKKKEISEEDIFRNAVLQAATPANRIYSWVPESRPIINQCKCAKESGSEYFIPVNALSADEIEPKRPLFIQTEITKDSRADPNSSETEISLQDAWKAMAVLVQFLWKSIQKIGRHLGNWVYNFLVTLFQLIICIIITCMFAQMAYSNVQNGRVEL